MDPDLSVIFLFPFFFFFQVCKLCPQSALTTGRISTWKVQASFFSAMQALEGSISAVTGEGLFSPPLADCLGLKA